MAAWRKKEEGKWLNYSVTCWIEHDLSWTLLGFGTSEVIRSWWYFKRVTSVLCCGVHILFGCVLFFLKLCDMNSFSQICQANSVEPWGSHSAPLMSLLAPARTAHSASGNSRKNNTGQMINGLSIPDLFIYLCLSLQPLLKYSSCPLSLLKTLHKAWSNDDLN